MASSAQQTAMTEGPVFDALAEVVILDLAQRLCIFVIPQSADLELDPDILISAEDELTIQAHVVPQQGWSLAKIYHVHIIAPEQDHQLAGQHCDAIEALSFRHIIGEQDCHIHIAERPSLAPYLRPVEIGQDHPMSLENLV
jgi:hypothetical protein